MPYVRRRKSYSRRPRTSYVRSRPRRKSIRGRSRRKSYSKVSRKWPIWKNPLPQQSLFKFVYQDSRFNLATNLAGGYKTVRLWRGNSLNDPDYTGVGVQPYGYDNLCGPNAPFGRYLVYGSKITVYPHVYAAATSTASNYSMRMILFPLYGTSVSYDEFEDLCRLPYSRRKVIESANDTKNVVSCYASTRKIIADSGDLSGGYYSAGYNANPPMEWYWHLYMDSNEFQNDTNSYVDVKITYYCKLFKVDDVNES